mmetsp:Transcript_82074/g.231004  ORF Transcript_82074/g.231004 Transcript_82074/m.231004 type:complete len:364 (+) Transcript_82074:232-1323(+)
MHSTAALPADPTWAAPFRWLIASRRTLSKHRCPQRRPESNLSQQFLQPLGAYCHLEHPADPTGRLAVRHFRCGGELAGLTSWICCSFCSLPNSVLAILLQGGVGDTVSSVSLVPGGGGKAAGDFCLAGRRRRTFAAASATHRASCCALARSTALAAFSRARAARSRARAISGGSSTGTASSVSASASSTGKFICISLLLPSASCSLPAPKLVDGVPAPPLRPPVSPRINFANSCAPRGGEAPCWLRRRQPLLPLRSTVEEYMPQRFRRAEPVAMGVGACATATARCAYSDPTSVSSPAGTTTSVAEPFKAVGSHSSCTCGDCIAYRRKCWHQGALIIMLQLMKRLRRDTPAMHTQITLSRQGS